MTSPEFAHLPPPPDSFPNLPSGDVPEPQPNQQNPEEHHDQTLMQPLGRLALGRENATQDMDPVATENEEATPNEPTRVNPLRQIYHANRVRKWSTRVREVEFQTRNPLSGRQLRKAQDRGAIATSRRMGAGYDMRQHKKADKLMQRNSEQLVDVRAKVSGDGGFLSRWKLRRVINKADKYGIDHELTRPR